MFCVVVVGGDITPFYGGIGGGIGGGRRNVAVDVGELDTPNPNPHQRRSQAHSADSP